jgi:hypothetical protein
MIKVYNNAVSDSDLAWLRQDMANRFNNQQYVVKEAWNPDLIKKFYNLDDWKILEYRSEISKLPGDPTRQFLEKIVYQYVPRHVWFYAAYQRQFIPQGIHVDDIEEIHNLDWCFSGIIPLDPNVGDIHKTIVWNKSFNTTEKMFEYIRTVDKSTLNYQNKNSAKYDIEHTLDGMFEVLDFIDLDGVYNYQLNSLGLFTRTNMHCSSNWRKYNTCEYKDFVILHFA